MPVAQNQIARSNFDTLEKAKAVPYKIKFGMGDMVYIKETNQMYVAYEEKQSDDDIETNFGFYLSPIAILDNVTHLNLGTGEGKVFLRKDRFRVKYRTIIGKNDIKINQTENEIEIDLKLPNENVLNLGTGAKVAKQRTFDRIELRSLQSSFVSENLDEIEINIEKIGLNNIAPSSAKPNYQLTENESGSLEWKDKKIIKTSVPFEENLIFDLDTTYTLKPISQDVNFTFVSAQKDQVSKFFYITNQLLFNINFTSDFILLNTPPTTPYNSLIEMMYDDAIKKVLVKFLVVTIPFAKMLSDNNRLYTFVFNQIGDYNTPLVSIHAQLGNRQLSNFLKLGNDT